MPFKFCLTIFSLFSLIITPTVSMAKSPLSGHTRKELVEWFEYTAGAKSYGTNSDSQESIKKNLNELLTDGDIVLIKGSRSMQLDQLINELKNVK